MRFEENFIEINRGKFFYWEKNREKKETIIFLHGFPGNHKGLTEFAEEFDNFRLIIPDLPDCGKSHSLDKKHELKNYAEWLDGFLEKLSIDKCIVIGHSFGARLALFFGGNYKKRAEKIVLIVPVLGISGFVSFLGFLEYKIAEVLPKRLKKMWLANDLFQEISKHVISKTKSKKKRDEIMSQDKEEFKRFNAQTAIELFNDVEKTDLFSAAEKINVPSLVVSAEKDEIAPVGSLEKLAKKIEKGDLEIIKNSGHLVPVEEPAITAELVNKWISRFK